MTFSVAMVSCEVSVGLGLSPWRHMEQAKPRGLGSVVSTPESSHLVKAEVP